MRTFFNSLYADLRLPAIIVVLHFGAPGMKEFSDCTLQSFGYTHFMNVFMNRENAKYQVNPIGPGRFFDACVPGDVLFDPLKMDFCPRAKFDKILAIF